MNNFETDEGSAENFSRNFSQYIALQHDKPTVNEKGLEKLRELNAWIQFLNNNGDQVAAFYTPEDLQKKYSPIEVVQTYKYQEVDGNTTVFIGEAHHFSYLIGIKNQKIDRYVFTYDYGQVLKTLISYSC